jgi:signal transduction histidine kinase
MTPTKILGLLIAIAYVAALRALEVLDIQTAFEPVLLLPLLNTLFHGIIPIVVAFVAGKSYLKGGSLTVLLMGCGMLAFGLCAIPAGWVIGKHGGPNLTVTIHNTGVFLGALFHATGGVLGLIPSDRSYDARQRKSIIFIAYAGIILFVLFFSYATLRNWIPPFFIQGVGPTDLRQTVLGSSIILYFISCVFFMTNYFRLKSDFLYWYSLCLALICMGLFGIFIQKAVGSPIGWLGRSALYVGGVFALAAVVSALRAAKAQGGSLEQSISDSFQHVRGSNARGLLPALPIPIILVLLVIMASLDFRTPYDPPGLRASVNTLFLCIFPLGAVYFATKGYLQSGLFPMLMLGSGALTLGSGSFVSNWTLGLQGVGSNATTTIFNLSFFFSGIFHLIGAATAFVGGHRKEDTRHTGLVLACTYIGVGVLVAMLTFATLKDLVPVFFVQGQGPTPLRQVVLGSAVFLFSISGLLLLSLYFFSKTRMLYWYSLALLLIAAGLICYMANTSIGGPIAWLGRCSLYLSGVYLLVAVISASRDLHVRGDSPAMGIANLFRHHLEVLVEERTLQLSRAKEELLVAHNDLERANAELFRTNQQLRALMEALPVGVSFSDDASCQRITGNPCLFSQFEITPEDNISASAPDPSAPGRAMRFFRNGSEMKDSELPLQRAVAENRVVPPMELEVLLPSGRRWFTDASGAPILDEAGKVVGGIAVSVDITERKRAEEELRNTLERFYTILANQYAGLLLVSEEGRVEFANQAFCDQFRLKVPPSALHGLVAPEVIQQIQHAYANPTRELDRIREILQQQRPVKGEEIAVAGGRTYLRDFIPLRIDGQPYGRLWHHQDVTDIKLAAEALQKAHDELELRVQERTSELEAKNLEMERFIYTVSHDLKSPLITINTFLGFVSEDVNSGNRENLQADVERIYKATDKMGKLLNEILELSRIGRMVNPPSEAPLADVVNEALQIMSGRLVQSGVEISLAPNLPELYGDRHRLEEVFQNLIENSLKFMGDQPHPKIEIGARADGEETILFVRDNGIGIDPLFHKKVFGLFDKLDPKAEGTGIGLALVKRIVEVHGGRIWVESDGIGSGSTFCFTLPRPHFDKR